MFASGVKIKKSGLMALKLRRKKF